MDLPGFRALAAIAVVYFLAVNANGTPSDIQSVISRHDSGQAGLRSFRLEADVSVPNIPTLAERLTFFTTPSARTLVPWSKSHWIVDGDRERIMDFPIGVRRDPLGRVDRIYELVIKDEKVYSLQNWDRISPQLISPSEQGSVKAQIMTHTSEFRWIDPAMDTIFRPRFDTLSPRSRLRDLVSRFSSQKLTESELSAVLRLSGDHSGFVKVNETIEVELSKTNNYLISRLSIFRNVVVGYDVGSDFSERSFVVKEFKDCGNGIFFPAEVECSIVDSASKNRIVMSLWKLTTLSSVNEAIPEDQLTMVFPEDSVVMDSTETGTVKWLLWGKNNEPSIRVMSSEELR